MGGMAGYAHWGSFAGAERGMSIDVPLGKADFVEVLHFYKMNTDVLYQFWNLGFKVIPTAGSDFPWVCGRRPRVRPRRRSVLVRRVVPRTPSRTHHRLKTAPSSTSPSTTDCLARKSPVRTGSDTRASRGTAV